VNRTKHTAAVRNRNYALLIAGCCVLIITLALLGALSGCGKKRAPDDKTVHQAISTVVRPMASASPDNCSPCHN
jgi:hypothetical protein